MSLSSFENYKKEKIEYDKKIRNLDYKIVEDSVKLSNIINRSKILESKNKEEENELKKQKLYESIKELEKEKAKVTKEIFLKFDNIRKEILEILDKKSFKEKDVNNELFKIKMYLNNIQDVYFDIERISSIENIIENEKSDEKIIYKNNNLNLSDERRNEEELLNKNLSNIQTNNIFDIPKQRVIDFENLLKHIFKISKEYRKKIEDKIINFVSNYDILKGSEFVENEFNNIKENFITKFNMTISKFEKDENLEEINMKMHSTIKDNNEIKQKIERIILENEIMREKIEKLQDVYIVNNYAKKILNNFIKIKASIDNKEYIIKEDDDIVFKKIKKITYDERMKHIISVSKWTKSIENKLKYYNLEEKDFQNILYLIRQTENICNINYEKITNFIIELSDCYIQLEQAEKENKYNRQILYDDLKMTNVLKEGINIVKKKYLKIPFIGRKVQYILNPKQLNP